MSIHCFQIQYRQIKQHHKTRAYKILLFTVLTALYGYTLWMVINFIFLLPPLPLAKYCNIRAKAAAITYFIAKMFMYLSFITRLYTVYNNPIYQYNVNIIKISFILAIISTIIICMLVPFGMNHKYHIVTTTFGQNFIICEWITSSFLIISFGLYDIIFSIGSLNPLRKLIKSMVKDSDKDNSEFFDLIIAGI